MIIQVRKDIAQNKLEEVYGKIKQIGYKYSNVITPSNHYIICIGKADFDIRELGCLESVIDIHVVSDSYQLVSRKWRVKPTEIKIEEQTMIKEGDFSVIAGPCSVESEEQLEAICKLLVKNNIKIIRGGVFKPRSSPYTFRGLGIEGLKMFSRLSKQYNLKIITEVMEISQIEQMYEYTDIFQVGTRNSQNFNLLEELGKIDKPVLVKRAMSGTIDELLHSAEYIFSSGNENLILCERGIRTYEDAYRNTLDLNAVPILKEKTHLPVIVDPSHGIGIRRFVEPMTLAAIMTGCDGVIIEIHPKPEQALSDAQQTLNFQEAETLFQKIEKVVKLKNQLM